MLGRNKAEAIPSQSGREVIGSDGVTYSESIAPDGRVVHRPVISEPIPTVLPINECIRVTQQQMVEPADEPQYQMPAPVYEQPPAMEAPVERPLNLTATAEEIRSASAENLEAFLAQLAIRKPNLANDWLSAVEYQEGIAKEALAVKSNENILREMQGVFSPPQPSPAVPSRVAPQAPQMAPMTQRAYEDITVPDVQASQPRVDYRHSDPKATFSKDESALWKAVLAEGVTTEQLPAFKKAFMAQLEADRRVQETAAASARAAAQRTAVSLSKPTIAPSQQSVQSIPSAPQTAPRVGLEDSETESQAAARTLRQRDVMRGIRKRPKTYTTLGVAAVLVASGAVIAPNMFHGSTDISKAEASQEPTDKPTKIDLKPVVPPVTAAELAAAITGCMDSPVAEGTVDYTVPTNWGYVGANNVPATLQFKEKDPKSTATSLVKPVYKDTAAPLQVGICVAEGATTDGLVTLSKDGKTATVDASKISSIGVKLGTSEKSYGAKIPSAYDPQGVFEIAKVVKNFVDSKVMTAAEGDKLIANYNNKDNQSTEAGLGQLAAAQAIGNPASPVGAQILSTLPSAIAESAKLAMQHQGQTPITVEVTNADKLAKLDVKNKTTAKPSDLFTLDAPVVANLQIAAVTQASGK